MVVQLLTQQIISCSDQVVPLSSESASSSSSFSRAGMAARSMSESSGLSVFEGSLSLNQSPGELVIVFETSIFHLVSV